MMEEIRDIQIDKSIILFLILLFIPLSGIGIDVYVPSLPAIKLALHAHHTLAKMTVSVYLLGFALGQIFVGPLSDSFGRRKVILIGMFCFALFSLLAAFSKSVNYLIVMRFLQGLAVTTPVIIAKAVATDCYTTEELKKVSTYLVLAWSIGPIIAPVIGGFLQTYIDWQANFYFLFIYSALLFFIALKLLPETNQNIALFSYTTIKNNYFEVLSSSCFVGSVICLAIGYSFIVVFNVISPFLIQNVLGYSALAYGHIALFMGFGCFLGSIFNRFIIKKASQNIIIISGILIILLSSLLLIILAYKFKPNLLCAILPIFLIFLCIGFVYPNCSAKCLTMFPKMAGISSAVMGVLTILGTAIMASIASIVSSGTAISLAWIYIILSIGLFVICYKFVFHQER